MTVKDQLISIRLNWVSVDKIRLTEETVKVKLISICLLQALNWVSADKIRLAEVTAKDRQTLIEPFMYLGETFFLIFMI